MMQYNGNREPLHNINHQITNSMNDTYNINGIDVALLHFNTTPNENMDPSQKRILNEIKSVINNNAQLQESKINNLYVRRQHNKSNKSKNCNDSISKINTNQLKINCNTINSANSINSINSINSLNSSSFITNNNDNNMLYLSSAESMDCSSAISISYNNINNKKNKVSSLFRKLTNLVSKQPQQQSEEQEQQEEAEEEEEIFTPSTGNTPRINVKSITPIFTDDTYRYSNEYITQIIGTDTFITDYIYQLFIEEKKCKMTQLKILHNKQRQNVIEWICGTGIHFDLQRSTIYKTIYYFDKLCELKEINTTHVLMIAATCLLIAIKWNEKEEKVPTLYKLSRICNKQYTPISFKPMELKILTALDFKLKIVLPIDFVMLYINIGCIFNNDKLDNHFNLHLHNQSKIYLKKFAIFFLDISCQNYQFYSYLPSILAFAVIIASRRALKIEPYFNKKLIKLCHYQSSQIKTCFDELWSEYNTKFPSDAKRAQKLQPQSINMEIDSIC